MKKFSSKCAIFALAGLLACSAFADLHMESSDRDNAGLTFHANFDYSMKAQRSSGNPRFKVFGPGKERFAPGCMNQGLRIGKNKAGIKNARTRTVNIMPVITLCLNLSLRVLL